MIKSVEYWTEHFYAWDIPLRGYFRYDNSIALEPPYRPFNRYAQAPAIDDGRVEPWWSPLLSPFVSKATPQVEVEDSQEIEIRDAQKELSALRITLPIIKVSSQQATLLLDALRAHEHHLSFEIISTADRTIIQFVGSSEQLIELRTQVNGIYPSATTELHDASLPFGIASPIGIVEFGLAHEVVCPLSQTPSGTYDSLTAFFNACEGLVGDEAIVLQILFEPTKQPWSRDMRLAVTDGAGGSFFKDDAHMVQHAQLKTQHPLFAVVMRLAVCGDDDMRTEHIASMLIHHLTKASASASNELVPLTNAGMPYHHHLWLLEHRLSNRTGMLLNAHELAQFVHVPEANIISPKVRGGLNSSKPLPDAFRSGEFKLGVNNHAGTARAVHCSGAHRLRHMHVIGATGTGKSTFLSQLILQDIDLGYGVILFDPHGDMAEDVLKRIPQHRVKDTILIDPADEDFPIGFNILKANTAASKLSLASDVVAAIAEQSTSWGDVMTTVLSNTLNAFIDSSRGGTLIELKRFLIEKSFRQEFLTTADDAQTRYYFTPEFDLLRKQALLPLLNRIDTFLRPLVLRRMFAQRRGFDFDEALAKRKIVVIKLSLGLIGKANSALLGALLLASLNRAAMERQSNDRHERSNTFVYLDEFQNLMTSSFAEMLTGLRKYGLGLTIAHHSLSQIRSSELKEATIANPFIRVCFRLGDNDARTFASGFSGFEAPDLMNLDVGQTIARIGRSNADFNMTFAPLAHSDDDASAVVSGIKARSRSEYATAKQDVDRIIDELYDTTPEAKPASTKKRGAKSSQPPPDVVPIQKEAAPEIEADSTVLEGDVESFKQRSQAAHESREHTRTISKIAQLAQSNGYRAHREHPTPDGKRIDVLLVKADVKIAIEVSVTNKVAYELSNLDKCQAYGAQHIIMVSDTQEHLMAIQHAWLQQEPTSNVLFFSSEQCLEFLSNNDDVPPQKSETRIKGYRVKVKYSDTATNSASLIDTIKSALRKQSKKD